MKISILGIIGGLALLVFGTSLGVFFGLSWIASGIVAFAAMMLNGLVLLMKEQKSEKEK